MDDHSLALLEFPRVTSAIAAQAESVAGRATLEAWRPIADGDRRAEENARLAEAIRRQGEPGEWCRVGSDVLTPRLDPRRGEGLDGPGLVVVRSWLEAARESRALWEDEDLGARFPALAGCIGRLPALDRLRQNLAVALEPDGSVSDGASPALKRARAELATDERALEQRLERWARGFGPECYVTRHAERFVAMVPAAGFPRRRGIVHDVSGSGQSLFVEPLEMCEANNRLIELRGRVADEERRILKALAGEVRAEADSLTGLESVLVALDTLRARARWARQVQAVAVAPGGEWIRLRGARHPLLAMGERRTPPVPLDLELGPGGRVLLVSGPNMGGKTVLLKTVGLAIALSHAALPVPAAEGSALPSIEHLRVDLGDEQSVDQGLSTFAAHLRALATMADEAGPVTLVLCDELGAGTDPEEGAALGRALLEHFAARGAWGIVTTHLGSLKRAAGEVAGVVSGSLEFEVSTLTPRFRFLPGIPGASHALAVAGRLGFPEPLLARARALTPEESRALERLLAELQGTHARMEGERESLARARREAEAAEQGHRQATEQVRQSLEALRRRLTAESESLLARARELWQTVQREARRAERSREGATRLRDRLAAVERDAESLQRSAREALPGGAGPEPAPAAEALVVGGRVRVVDLGVEAELVSGPDAEGKVVLRRGGWTIHSHVSRLGAPGEDGGTKAAALPPGAGAPASWELPDETPALELDLRGMEMGQALDELDRGLDRAVLSGLSELRIVHGVGRGILRAAVERHLRGHPQVALQRLGAVGEGGRGVTVVRLR